MARGRDVWAGRVGGVPGEAATSVRRGTAGRRLSSVDRWREAE